MKLFKTLLFATMAIFLVTSCSDDDKKSQDPSVLPTTATSVISTYFPGQSVSRVEVDRDSNDYDVTLSDGTEIEFDKDGNVVEIDCSRSGGKVPDSFVNANIRSYVATNYPGQNIVKYEVRRNGFEAELTSGIELVFNKQGDYLGGDSRSLPAEADDFISSHFPGTVIVRIEVDRESGEYDVILSDGTELEFDRNGILTEVDCKRGLGQVPDALVNPTILSYVAKNFPGQAIVKYEVESNGYEVELKSGLELEFDKNGTHKGEVANDLPASVTDFISQYFPGVTIIRVEIERNSSECEVTLSDYTELEFDRNGNLEEIDCARGTGKVPDALVLPAILSYVSANYSGQNIVKYEIERDGYEAELKSGWELEFDKQGNFLKFDR